jgi:hypothetical protein
VRPDGRSPILAEHRPGRRSAGKLDARGGRAAPAAGWTRPGRPAARGRRYGQIARLERELVDQRCTKWPRPGAGAAGAARRGGVHLSRADPRRARRGEAAGHRRARGAARRSARDPLLRASGPASAQRRRGGGSPPAGRNCCWNPEPTPASACETRTSAKAGAARCGGAGRRRDRDADGLVERGGVLGLPPRRYHPRTCARRESVRPRRVPAMPEPRRAWSPVGKGVAGWGPSGPVGVTLPDRSDAVRAAPDAVRAGPDAVRAGSDAVRAGPDAVRAGPDAVRAAPVGARPAGVPRRALRRGSANWSSVSSRTKLAAMARSTIAPPLNRFIEPFQIIPESIQK